jgi:EmrB/QacA subfamily drug resistance transporter
MTTTAPGTAGASPSARRTVLLVAVLASFMAILDGNVVNLALPAMAGELGGGLASQQWIVDAYLLTLGALILVAGALSDAYGRVRVLRWGLLGFAATSVFCGLAGTDTMLIAARGLQGIAGALLVPSSLALIMAAYPPADQGRAIGIWTASTGAATIVSPLIGGAAVDLLSWRLIFFINLLPFAVAMPMLSRLRGEGFAAPPPAAAAVRVDYAGAALAVMGLAGPVFAFIHSATAGWQHPSVWIPLAAGVLALGLFLRHEARTARPMMPLGLFRERNFAAGNIATFAIYGGLSFGFLVLVLYFQQVAGLSATAAGVALLPSTVMLLVLSSAFGSLAARHGPRWFMAGGPVLAGAGFLWLLAVRPGLDYWSQVLPGLLVFGVGLAMTVAPLTAAILGAVPPEQAGIGSAVNNAVARIAGLVTIALAGVVVGPALDLAALQRSVVATAALLFAGGIAAAIGIRNPAARA